MKEITIKIPDDESLRAALMAQMLDIAYDSFMETDQNLVAYIDDKFFDQDRLREILQTFRGQAAIVKTGDLAEQNWNAIWESSYDPVIIDKTCIARAPFHKKPDGFRYDIVIQPKMSFGTAHHATTCLMLQMLLQHDFAGKKVLDMGSGTGVLAILSSMLGASQIVAIDNDEWAYKNAIENCQLNAIKNIDVIFGDASAIPSYAFDVVLANINRNILLDDMWHYNKHLSDGATVFLSGFYESDLPAIATKASELGWKFFGKEIRNEWVAAKFGNGSNKK
jgi:ribosomal protein L11 methyltransferase